jgi:hypothetical protein
VAAKRIPQHPNDNLTNTQATNHLFGTELLSVTVLQHDHAVVVAHVAGEVDMLTGPSLQWHLDKALATQPERLIVALSEVSFLGAAGLAVRPGRPAAPTGDG